MIATAIPATPSAHVSSRERQLFDLMTTSDSDVVIARDLLARLTEAGVGPDDPRLAATIKALKEPAGIDTPLERPLDFTAFSAAVEPSILTVERALLHQMVIPDFPAFRDTVISLFERVRDNRRGDVASYIPQLSRIDPEQFGLGVCTVDGQRFSHGDAATPFSVQSSSKIVGYCSALEDQGEETVHRHIGREPSGRSFNELALNPDGLPHNPLINAGAIMSLALVKPDAPLADRFEHLTTMWTKLAGGARPGYSNPTYLSERQTADRNFALGYFMRENGAFPEGTNLLETLEFYFQACSIEMTVETFSVVAATLANGGVNPVTGKVVLRPDTVRKCLSLMYSCGMYDFSGEWAFSVGLPAKSSVSGVVVVVVPNVMGLVVWSPRLDRVGNSVRGVEFSRDLVRTFNFHNYDTLVGGANGKIDPRRRPDHARHAGVVDLCWAASKGDLAGLRRLIALGANPAEADYDGRTPLHLAASEGQQQVLEYLLRVGVSNAPVDRWGHTPLDDAIRAGHHEVVELLGGR